MGYDWAEPYGTMIETRVRLVTWNIWGTEGPWGRRKEAIQETLERVDPDLVALQEAADLPNGLGYHQVVVGQTAVLSRWPIVRWLSRSLSGGSDGVAATEALFVEIEGPRGPIQLFTVCLGAYRLDHGMRRQGQVRELGEFVVETASRRGPTVICGDFNARPDSDEIRMLTGRGAGLGFACYDAWETAGSGDGVTWSMGNPWAAPVLWPDMRIDYVFSVWPRRGGAGHPVRCEVIGTEEVGGVVPSDHYGVLAELRY